jgi:osmoprotectant transport system ATP-binding protein
VGALIELNDVRKRFGPAVALDGIDLRIEPLRTTVLLGESGSGKSTLLRVILGLVAPDHGTVRVDGSGIEPESVESFRRRIGFVVQGGGLFPHLTARENVTLVARYLRWPAAKIGDRVAALVALTRFPADALDRHPAQLSGGQAQRVSLMRALMLDPEILLLDEPLGALDPVTRRELQNDLKTLFAQVAKTVVFVTHDLGEAAFFADQVVLLRDGRIVQAGTLESLVRSPADPFVTEFIQASRMPPGLAL